MIQRRMYVPVLFIAGLLIVPATVRAQSKPLKKINVGVPAISMGNIIIFFAKEAKLFE